MATHSSILAWKIPWTEEPGGLQSMRLQRVRHDRDCTTKTWIILIDCVALTGYGEKGRGWAEGCWVSPVPESGWAEAAAQGLGVLTHSPC